MWLFRMLSRDSNSDIPLARRGFHRKPLVWLWLSLFAILVTHFGFAQQSYRELSGRVLHNQKRSEPKSSGIQGLPMRFKAGIIPRNSDTTTWRTFLVRERERREPTS
jgi:hypothetical protein